jgi:DHA1 family inner membrane transport protein
MFLFVFATGFASQGLGPAIQTRLMDVAGDSQSLAAALNHSALNIGNALGAFLGGVVIAGGLGYLAPVWTGVVLTVIGLGIVITSFTVERRQLRRELLRANDAEERRIADRNPPTAPIPV